MTFLEQTTKQLIENKTFTLCNTMVVLPSQRACRQLEQLLNKLLETENLPKILTINDFIENLSLLKKADDLQLLTELYQLYICQNEKETTDLYAFLSWSTLFLHDINDIDMQMANAHSVFQNLHNIKELEVSFGKEQLSENQQKYLNLYKTLEPLYSAFTAQLKEEKIGYEGLIYRDVAENIAEYAAKYTYQRYVFAGFHFFNPTEIQIIKYFQLQHHVDMLFDFDEFYYSNFKEQIEDMKNQLHLPEIQFIENSFHSIPKHIEVMAVNKKLSQILYAKKLIEAMNEKDKNNTLLLLADENLVFPLSHELDTSQINITMGKPLKETAVATFIQSCFQLAQNSARFNKYYHRDLLAWLHNPFFKLYCPQAEEFILKMTNSNRIFYSFNEICIFLGEWKIVHEKWNIDGMIFLENLLENMQRIHRKISMQHHFQEVLTLIIPVLENFVLFFKKLPQDKIDLKTLHYFLNEKLNAIRIPYQYNAENELQVMGLLETRCLDFKNIIVLSLNEGILPEGKDSDSLLLYELKKYFKLPLTENKVRVFAAHFFRLLQRAENIYLIYNTDSSENLAEKSRFIRQLEFEIKAQNLEKNLTYSESSLDFQKQKWQSAQPIVYKKTSEVIIKLLKHSYSTSSLNAYILCPLKFYLQHIEKIEKPKTVTETVEQNVIGTIIHDILRHIFLKIKENPTDFQYIFEEEKKELDRIVFETFYKNEDLKGQDPTQGRLFLYTEIVKKNIDTYIDEACKEMQQSAIEILSVEELLQGNLSVNQKDICLKGFADRIDKRQNILTILDYKTGKVDEKELKINNLEELFQDPKKGKLFQLFFYGLLYKQKLKQESTPYFNAGIISFQNLHKNGKSILLPDIEEFNKLLPDFEKRLNILIQEIINPNISFTQTDNPNHCKYCDYQDLCGIQTEHSSF